MNKKEWQKHYGLDDEDMERLSLIIKIFGGTITCVKEKSTTSKASLIRVEREKKK